MDICEFKESDQQQVIDLILNIQRNEFGFSITLEDQPDLNTIPTFYQQGKGNFWVAKIDSKIVGSISLLDIGDNNVALRKMFVAEPFRGAEFGVAQRLLHTLLEWANENQIKSIYLGTTDRFKAAHRFYEKHGFSLIQKAELPSTFQFMDVDTRFYQYQVAR